LSCDCGAVSPPPIGRRLAPSHRSSHDLVHVAFTAHHRRPEGPRRA
jgi:hypothetical protein